MDDKKRIVITGMGVYCSAGRNVDELYQQLHNNQTGIKQFQLFNTQGLNSDYFGAVNDSLPRDVENVEDESRLVHIIEKLINELIESGNISKSDIEDMLERCQLSFATSVGLNEYRTGYVDARNHGSHTSGWMTKIPEYLIRPFQNKLGIRGAYSINSAACTAGTTAIGTAVTSIRCDLADMVVVCAVDPLTQSAAYGFNSLNNVSHSICNPFDKSIDGITLGEGGAIFILEEYEHAKRRNAKIYCEVFGYGIGNDAYHITSPDISGNGAYRVMKRALDDAGVKAEDIDYINTHGTGTERNDNTEIAAIKLLYEGIDHKKVYVTSTKSYIGHCLAAAGGIELVATILSINHNEIFPNYGLQNCLADIPDIEFVKEHNVYSEIQYAISNSYAFAGSSASVVVGKMKCM